MTNHNFLKQQQQHKMNSPMHFYEVQQTQLNKVRDTYS